MLRCSSRWLRQQVLSPTTILGKPRREASSKPAETALHNLTTLLSDKGASVGNFSPASLDYSLSTGDDTFWRGMSAPGPTARR